MAAVIQQFGRIFPLLLALGIAVLLSNIHYCSSLNNVGSIQYILQKFNYSRNTEYSPNNKEKARKYIKSVLDTQGYKTELQTFKINGISGTNVVGRKDGKFVNSINDRIFIVGAHYDTYKTSPGIDGSASGLTAMLQIARQYSDKDRNCEQNGTIVFVAFDQAQYCTCSNYTCCFYGSQAFIEEFTKNLRSDRARGKIEGAVILDSIMNFDRTPNIQNLTVFDKITDSSVKDVIKKIKADGSRGDFLMAIGRQDGDTNLLNNITKYYTKGKSYDEMFKLHKFTWPLQEPPSDMGHVAMDTYRHLFMGDHYRFWNNKNPYVVDAILLTDSANLRGYMKYCYHNSCDDFSHVTSTRLQFMANIADAVAMMAREITGLGQCTSTLFGNITKQLYGESGEFTSPGYPNHYPNDADSVWYITVPSQHSSIKLTFPDFDLEQSECTSDFVNIYDGFDDKLIGHFCGKTPPKDGIKTKTRYMKVKFKSDAYDTYKGFKAQWKAQGTTLKSTSVLLLCITSILVHIWI